MIKDADIALLVGRRGSGKTTLVKTLIRVERRLVVFDPIDEYHQDGLTRCTSLAEVLTAIRRGRARGFKIAYYPKLDGVPEKLHALSLLLWEVQQPYFAGEDARKLTLVVDELNLSFPVAQLPKNCQAFTRLVLQGRHAGINIYGITQRPAVVSAVFRDNARRTYMLPVADATSMNTLAALIGREHLPKLRALEDHHWLLWDNGKLSSGQNRLSRRRN